MSAPRERLVQVAGGECRIWEKGEGEPLGVLPGLGGLPRWAPFLDALAQERRVIVPSLPGFPGSGDQHRMLDGHLDWIAATLDLLEAAELSGFSKSEALGRPLVEVFVAPGHGRAVSRVLEPHEPMAPTTGAVPVVPQSWPRVFPMSTKSPAWSTVTRSCCAVASADQTIISAAMAMAGAGIPSAR